MSGNKMRFIISLFLLSYFDIPFINLNVNVAEAQNLESARATVVIHNLDECLDMALKNNRSRKVSSASVAIAESQYKQAVSAYWPQLRSNIAAVRLDSDPEFLIPSQNLNIMGMPFPVNIPEMKVKLMDQDLVLSGIDLTYPIFTGGKISSISKQAKIGINAAKEASRKTDLQVIYDVKRMYYSVILASSLKKIGQETRERMEATRDLTEHLFNASSGKVKKTDYLKTKLFVSNVSSMLELLISNEELAQAALINSLGLNWNTRIELLEQDIPHKPYMADLDALIADTYQFSPDWARIQLGLDAAEAKIREAKSGYYPTVAFTGSLSHIENSYDAGLMTSNNRNNWRLGIALELPIFKGFRTVNEVKEARARLDKINEEKILISEGLALQVKAAFLQISRAEGQIKALKESLDASSENRELNMRAYQEELVETGEVIESQIFESFVHAQYLKAIYDSAVHQAELDIIIGKEMAKLLK